MNQKKGGAFSTTRRPPAKTSQSAIVRESILDLHYLVIQSLWDKVVDRRDIASDGLIETLACFLFCCAAHGAAREGRTLRGIPASVIRNYSDAQLHLIPLRSHQTKTLLEPAIPEDSFRPSPHLLDDRPC